MSSPGYGSIEWGSGGWGAGESPLQLLTAQPVRDNVVRLTFDQPVFFTGTGEPGDGSNIVYYSITPVDGTTGADGLPARPVFPALAALAAVEGSGGSMIDVTVDRPFSPAPAQYIVAVNNLRSATGTLLLVGATSTTFDGCYRVQTPPLTEHTYARRDFANPQTLAALGDSTNRDPGPSVPGSYVADETGDYARDQGLLSYKKRVFRRCMTRKGAFAHMPNYGLGLIDQVKKLSKASVRETLASDAESQIRLEPETADVKCRFVQSSVPGLYFLKIRAKTIAGEALSDDVPFNASEAT